MGRLSRRLFGVPEVDVTFERRGFRGGDAPGVRPHIENVGRSFLAGYHAALEGATDAVLVARLDETDVGYRGFTYEGAAMGLALLDAMTPWRRHRLGDFLAGRGGDHVYMAHVGAGWAIARLPFGMAGILSRLDPLLCWLAFDGYGFHQGYFDWPHAVEGHQEVPRRVRGYGRRSFDQGLGRSLWFVDGADVERIPRTIATFQEARWSDLWSGVGLAATYAGGVDEAAITSLRDAGRGFEAELAQGAAFGAKARLRAGNMAANVETTCQILCGSSAPEAAQATDRALDGLPADGDVPAYEVWRRRIMIDLTAPR